MGFERLVAGERNTILAVMLFLFVMSVVRSGYYTIAYGGTDLRSISIAAKMLDSSPNAYFYRWSPGEPEKYLDPNVPPNTITNAVTVAPGTLYVLSLFNSLSYPALRIAWTVVQYLLILYVFGYFFVQKGNSPESRFNILVIGGLFFLCTPVWFLNIERGQVYVLFAFLFTIIYQLYSNSNSASNYLAGLVIALACYCRPNFIFLMVPVLVAVNRRAIVGFVGGAALLGVHAWLHRGLWEGYSAALHEFSSVGPAGPVADRPRYVYPSTIEGMHNLTKVKADFTCGGLHPINTFLAPFFRVSSIYFYVALLIAAIIALVLIFRKELARKEASTILLFGFLLYMTAEYIMPTSRSAYNLVLWVIPVLIFLQRPRLSPWVFILLITGLCFINGAPFYFPFIHDIGEALLIFSLLYYLRSASV